LVLLRRGRLRNLDRGLALGLLLGALHVVRLRALGLRLGDPLARLALRLGLLGCLLLRLGLGLLLGLLACLLLRLGLGLLLGLLACLLLLLALPTLRFLAALAFLLLDAAALLLRPPPGGGALNGASQRPDDQIAGADRVIVAGNDIVDGGRVAVGVDQADD